MVNQTAARTYSRLQVLPLGYTSGKCSTMPGSWIQSAYSFATEISSYLGGLHLITSATLSSFLSPFRIYLRNGAVTIVYCGM